MADGPDRAAGAWSTRWLMGACAFGVPAIAVLCWLAIGRRPIHSQSAVEYRATVVIRDLPELSGRTPLGRVRFRRMCDVDWVESTFDGTKGRVELKFDDDAVRIVELLLSTDKITVARSVVRPSVAGEEVEISQGILGAIVRFMDEESGAPVEGVELLEPVKNPPSVGGLETDEFPPTTVELAPVAKSDHRGELGLVGRRGEFRLYFVRGVSHAWRRILFDGMQGGFSSMDIPLRCGGSILVESSSGLGAIREPLLLLARVRGRRGLHVIAERGQPLPLVVEGVPTGDWALAFESQVLDLEFDWSAPGITRVTVQKGRQSLVRIP